MHIKLLRVLFLIICFNFSFAQKKETLLTIEGESVSSKEFLKLYNKNLDLVKDENQKQLDNYLELFVNYKSRFPTLIYSNIYVNKSYEKISICSYYLAPPMHLL